MSPQRSQKFYYQTVIFQVEDTLFKVPSEYFHKHSSVFGAASEISKSSELPEGSCDENPILLPLPNGATKDDFEQLLRVIYPLSMSYPLPTNLSRKEWLSVLKLATFWEFSYIRSLAITELSGAKYTMTTTEKVNFGREFKVESWLLDGYRGLIKQNDLIAFDELKTFGLETATKILYIRCKGFSPHYCTQCGYHTTANQSTDNCDAIIKEMFEYEFRDIGHGLD